MTLRLALLSELTEHQDATISDRLMRLLGVERPRIAYLASQPDPYRVYFEQARSCYKHLGADLAVYLDSETVPGGGGSGSLIGCDAVHLSGGNTYSFSTWLSGAGLFQCLRQFAADGGALIGVSAGAILITPCIDTASLCGDVADRAGGHETLGLVPFGFLPHWVPGQRLPAGALSHPIYACTDGAGVIVDGATIEAHGHVELLSPK
ncbi:Type 1 glutamine amidotransferase-like domain-containing protein [Ramlibacter sp. MMS24-I3-19]|uniref:Type 1 glutamine amidotransferase-like domain-containing protein n=1 Tax=Ramlibacter sp. MMS24-I3-19 TaxID=3416606 RepID=UPI003D00CF3B